LSRSISIRSMAMGCPPCSRFPPNIIQDARGIQENPRRDLFEIPLDKLGIHVIIQTGLCYKP
jgi:hypothetical protein